MSLGRRDIRVAQDSGPLFSFWLERGRCCISYGVALPVCEHGHGAEMLLGKERLKGFVSVPVGSKIDKLQVGPLQSVSLLCAFPEARDRWTPVEEFTTSPLLEVTTETG